MFLRTKYIHADRFYFIYEEISELREMCVRNPLNGRLERLDYTIYGAEGFMNQNWVDTQRWIELKNIYNDVMSECEPQMKK